MRDRRSNTMALLLLVSLAAAVAAGWQIFGLRSGGVAYHAVFLVSVGAAVCCSIGLLWRALSGSGRSGGDQA